MPLEKTNSKRAISNNIKEMKAAGHPTKQAVAAALDTARRATEKPKTILRKKPREL